MSGLQNKGPGVEVIQTASTRLDRWIEREGFEGYEPHDALNSPFLNWLHGGSRLIGIAFVQMLRRSPVNLRPILRIPKIYNPKAFGLFLSSYIRKYEQFGRAQDLEKVFFFCNWLRKNRAPGYDHTCWGYPFPWPNRAFFVPAGTPTAVNTAFIAFGFLDLYERLGDEEALETARSACTFFLKDLNHLEAPEGICFSYTPLDRRFVHNANMLIAAALARTGRLTGEPDLLEHSQRAVAFTVSRQSEEGSWPYGEGATEKWIDSFHTGFVLSALADYIEYAGDRECEATLRKGYALYRERFFLRGGAPKYYLNSSYPVDVHAAAQGILTFLRMRPFDAKALASAERVALWTIQNLQDPSGFFHYQIRRFFRNRIPYMRWGQAWMQRALTELSLAVSGAFADARQGSR